MRLAVTLALLCACGDNGARAPIDAAPRTCALACAPYRCDEQRGRCFYTCESADRCADTYECRDRACVGTQCTIATAVEQCGAYACVDGVCATNCAIASCAAGHYCRGDLDICMPKCTRVDDPICDGYVCDVSVGECESYCLPGELECTAGYTCDAQMRCIAD